MRLCLVALVLGLCAVRTTARLEDWRSEVAIWRAAVATSPALPRPALNLSVALARAGATSEAVTWAIGAAGRATARQDPTVRAKARQIACWVSLLRDPHDTAVPFWCASS